MCVKVKLLCGSSRRKSLFHYSHTHYWKIRQYTYLTHQHEAFCNICYADITHCCAVPCATRRATCASISHTAYELHSLCLSSLLYEGPGFPLQCIFNIATVFYWVNCQFQGHTQRGAAELQLPPQWNSKNQRFCRQIYLECFVWFALPTKSAAGTGWWLLC